MPRYKVSVETDWIGTGTMDDPYRPNIPSDISFPDGAYGDPLTEPCNAHCECASETKRTKLKAHKKKNGVKVKVIKDEVITDDPPA